MRITIEMHGELQRFGPAGGRPAQLEVAPGATVRDVLARLGMDLDEPWNAALDGRLAAIDAEVHDGSRLIVFAPIAGG